MSQSVNKLAVEVLDLQFLDAPDLIASYLIRRGDAVILIESGPGSTLPALTAGLERHGLRPEDVTHLLLTHIHLDHAGGAGWLAQRGAEVYVHEIGAKHMLDPSRLWSSATRIYGEAFMQQLWGEMLPVPKERLVIVQDNDVIEIAGLEFAALYTPGHASHHLAYLVEGTCFTGDVAGCSLPNIAHVRMPTPPPDLDLDLWEKSLKRLQEAKAKELYLTHFGVRKNPQEHLQQCEIALAELAQFIQDLWEKDTPKTEIIEAYFPWIEAKAKSQGAGKDDLQKFENFVSASAVVGGFMRLLKKRQEK